MVLFPVAVFYTLYYCMNICVFREYIINCNIILGNKFQVHVWSIIVIWSLGQGDWLSIIFSFYT